MSVAAHVDFKVIVDAPILDLPPEQRRYGLYRWKTARGRPTKWHLIDTATQMAESVGPYRADHDLPPIGSTPMLCGVRSRGEVRTLIRTWEQLCSVDPELAAWAKSFPPANDVCAACIIQVALAMTNELRKP